MAASDGNEDSALRKAARPRAQRAVGDIDLDFATYVALRRGNAESRAREGAAYAYSGDRKAVRALYAARPVTLAIEATVRLWRNLARAELLGSAVKVTDQQFPRIHACASRAAEELHLPTPVTYVSPQSGLAAHTLGTEDDAYVVVSSTLVEQLTDDELVFVIGHECGHIHNSHVVLATALHYLTHSTAFYVRWIVQPALLALRAWSRRAEITCDRAGLIACRDLGVATSAMIKTSLGPQMSEQINVEEFLKQLQEGQKSMGRFGELFRSHPYLPKRIEALRIFAQSHYYKQLVAPADERLRVAGLDAAECDLQVSRLVSVL